MSNVKFTGIMPALVTPLDAQGNVLTEVVKAIVDHNLKAGVDGFYVVGGTGEGVLLTPAQRRAMAEAAIAANAGRGKIIIHTGSFRAEEVMELTRHATEAGADGVSSVPPSMYFGYTMQETVDFYKRMADNTDLPLLVYANAQTGAGVDVNQLMEQLLGIDNVCGAKDTRGNYYKMWELKRLNGGDVNVINGPDDTLLCGLIVGADGGIGSTYSLMPELFVELYARFRAGDLAGAMATQERLNRLVGTLIDWAEGNVIRPVKESMRLSGWNVGSAVYPAQDYPPEKLAAFKAAMEAAGYVYPA